MSPDELRQHLSHAVQYRLVLLAEGGRKEVQLGADVQDRRALSRRAAGSGIEGRLVVARKLDCAFRDVRHDTQGRALELVREVAAPRGRLSTTPLARATKSIASPYTSSFPWSNGMRGIPSGSGSGSGAFTGDAKGRWTGLETHET
jgi:hypothetical protein